MSFLSEFDRKKVFKTSKYNEIRAKEGKSVKRNCSDYSLSITWKTDCDNVYPMFKQQSGWYEMIDDIVNWR